jgi:methionyl-tRNA formyltransferase
VPAPTGSGATRPLRIAFLGNDAWSVASLERLAGSVHEIVLVETARPKPARRGNTPTPTAVAAAARSLRLPVSEIETVRSGGGFDRLEQTKPDVLVVVAYGELLPPSVLDLPAIAPVNLHFSLLPALRGASPVQRALMLGLERTGVSTIVMDEGLDSGPILLQREVEIAPDDDAGTLGARLAAVGADLLVESLDLLATGRIQARAQEGEATFAPKIGSADRVLDWSRPATALIDRVRALSPAPAATTTFRGDPLKVYRAASSDVAGEPGRIVSVSKEGVVVGTGRGGLRLLDLAPAGRRRMSGADFVNGLRPEVGERIG